MKTKRIVVPVEDDHHAEILAYVKKKGFDSVAAYIRWLLRQDMGASAVEEDHS